MGALLPTLSAQTETQVWYGSSAGKPNSVHLVDVPAPKSFTLSRNDEALLWWN